ncbi:hypothetical protein RchiOBHm_Chr6g0249121 [Rosa chinensis]|uniref:Transmembrane protein n=1 Tax=Rosa chinensis TaxID=74649 RepID=A0A2P6PK76_ROSCH|nr:hypothetical protein RchiOBHm_Chr6g0249121 [Rosa chinensis]
MFSIGGLNWVLVLDVGLDVVVHCVIYDYGFCYVVKLFRAMVKCFLTIWLVFMVFVRLELDY